MQDRVQVISPDGTPGDVPREQLEEALRQGYKTAPVAEPSLLDRAKALVPSPRTTLRVGGAMIGGAIGGIGGTVLGTPISGVPGAALGGAAGASIGESLHDLGTRAGLFSDAVPSASGGETAQRQAGAIAQGALQEGVPAAISSRLPKVVELSAAKKVGEAVRASKLPDAAKRITEKVAPDAIKDFPVATSEGQLFTKLSEKAAEATKLVNDAYTRAEQSGVSMKAAPIIKKLQQDRAHYIIQGDVVPSAEAEVRAFDTVIDWLQKHPNFTPQEFRQAKQIWDKASSPFRGQTPLTQTESAIAEVTETAANKVRDVIHYIFPYIAKPDRDAHVWIQLKNALEHTKGKGFGKEALMQIIPRTGVGGTIGAGINLARGESPYKGAMEGAVIGALAQTTLWNTLSIRERALLMRAIQSKSGQAALRTIATVGSGAAEEKLDR